jgi:hypothetical protein
MGPEWDGAAGDRLIREANEVRSRLVRAIGALDGKRRDALDVGGRLKHAVELTAIAGLALLAVGGGAFLIHRASTARRRRWHQRWVLAQRAWRNPESLREREGTLSKVAKSVAAGVVTIIARRLVAKVLDLAVGPPPPPHLVLSARNTT